MSESTPTASRGSSISQRLRATKKILQDVTFGAKIAMTLDKAEFDVLEQDALEILRLIRTWKNDVAPINRIPPEILALIPDFWDTYDGGGGVIALTHVCRAWREVFTSRSSLWANINCEDADKTLVYFERSKSSPINLALYRDDALSPCDPFVRIIPHAIERLKSLSIKGTPMNLQDITANLPRPAPLLEELSIHGGRENARHLSPVLASVLFNGDLSLLRKLRLESVRTELPWRNMVNLTSFTLAHTLPGEVSVRRLLDFFEGAPHLHAVKLHSATRTSGARDKRLVSLALLKTMVIINGGPSSLLLSHLLIPAGAKLTTQMDSPRFLIEDHLPRSLSNLRNLSNFTTIELYGHDSCPHIRFSGPNGQVTIRGSSQFCGTSLVLGSLTQFDTSEVKRLEIYCGNSPSSDLPYHALLSMKDLRSLTLSRCKSPHTFIHALHPSVSSSGVLACPKLEELCFDGQIFDVNHIIRIAAARAFKGAKLKSMRIISRSKLSEIDLLELKKHVSCVDCGPKVEGAGSDGDGNNEEDLGWEN